MTTVQREPFLTSVWIIIVSAVLISVPLGYYIYDAHFSGFNAIFRPVTAHQFWSVILPDIIKLFALPVTVIFAGLHHFRKGINPITAIVFIIATLSLLCLCLYVSKAAYDEIELFRANDRLSLGYFYENLWAFVVLGVCYILVGLGLRTSITMLRYKSNRAIKPEIFE